MRNFKVTIAFDGGGYGGWQIQKYAYTLQQAAEDSIKKILKKNHRVTGCGRTDAGVHARGYVFSFKTESSIPENGLFRALHTTFPESIAVLEVAEVGLDFCAHFSAVAKRYVYRISNRIPRDPFADRYSLHFEPAVDEKAMDRAAKQFLGSHDFSAFCAAGAQNMTSVRTIYECGVTRSGDTVEFSVTANGFLYNMVRIMAGTLLYVSMGRIPQDGIEAVIQSKDRTKAGKTLPPHGLYLDKVYYDSTYMLLSKYDKEKPVMFLNKSEKEDSNG